MIEAPTAAQLSNRALAALYTVQQCIDQLAKMHANRELRTLSDFLRRLASRAMPREN